MQYLCKDYIALLNEHRFAISNSAKGNPYHNAFVESFIKTLKQEEVYLANFALSDYGGSSVAAGIAEVSVDERSGEIDVHRFWMVIDAGLIVAPRNTEAQMEGNVIYGLSNALKERITFNDGVVEQSNFHDYPVMRMNEVPEIEVKALASDKK